MESCSIMPLCCVFRLAWLLTRWLDHRTVTSDIGFHATTP